MVAELTAQRANKTNLDEIDREQLDPSALERLQHMFVFPAQVRGPAGLVGVSPNGDPRLYTLNLQRETVWVLFNGQNERSTQARICLSRVVLHVPTTRECFSDPPPSHT